MNAFSITALGRKIHQSLDTDTEMRLLDLLKSLSPYRHTDLTTMCADCATCENCFHADTAYDIVEEMEETETILNGLIAGISCG